MRVSGVACTRQQQNMMVRMVRDVNRMRPLFFFFFFSSARLDSISIFALKKVIIQLGEQLQFDVQGGRWVAVERYQGLSVVVWLVTSTLGGWREREKSVRVETRKGKQRKKGVETRNALGAAHLIAKKTNICPCAHRKRTHLFLFHNNVSALA